MFYVLYIDQISLVVSLGFNAIIVVLNIYDEDEEEWYGHVYIAVHLSYTPTTHTPSWYYNIDDLKYWICETTFQGWLMGDLPVSDPDYTEMQGYVHIT